MQREVRKIGKGKNFRLFEDQLVLLPKATCALRARQQHTGVITDSDVVRTALDKFFEELQLLV